MELYVCIHIITIQYIYIYMYIHVRIYKSGMNTEVGAELQQAKSQDGGHPVISPAGQIPGWGGTL